MKKNILLVSIIFILAGLFNFSPTAHLVPAAMAAACNDANQLCNPIAQNTVPELLLTVINFMLSILGLLAIIFVIWGGFQYVTSGGNEENTKKARRTITYALLGLALAILSFTVVRIVANTLTQGAGVSNTGTGGNAPPSPSPATPPAPNPAGGPATQPPTAAACQATASDNVNVTATSANGNQVTFGQSITINPVIRGGVPQNCQNYRIDITAFNADGTARAVIRSGAGFDGTQINVPITNAIFQSTAPVSNYTLKVDYLSTDPASIGVKFGTGQLGISVSSPGF